MSGCGGDGDCAGDGHDDTAVAPEAPPPLPSRRPPCRKCRSPESVVLCRAESLCRKCFELRTTHLFKTALRKRIGIVHKDRVLFAYSGGVSSTAMLNMAHDVMHGGGRRMVLDAAALFVDTSQLAELHAPHLAPEQLAAEVQAATATMRRLRFPAIVVGLEEVFSDEPTFQLLDPAAESGDALLASAGADAASAAHAGAATATAGAGDVVVSERLPSHAGRVARLRALFAKARTTDAKEDLLAALVRTLIASVAAAQGYKMVMLGSTAVRLAHRIISSTSKGGGYSLPLDIAPVDRRFSRLDVSFGLPMRDLEAKEVAFYCRHHGLSWSFFPDFATRAHSSRANISFVTEALVTNLQANFPATVHHILRAALKLVVPGPAGMLVGGFAPGEKQAPFGETMRERRRRQRLAGKHGDGASDAGDSVVTAATDSTVGSVAVHGSEAGAGTAATMEADERRNSVPRCALCCTPLPPAHTVAEGAASSTTRSGSPSGGEPGATLARADRGAGATIGAFLCYPCQVLAQECDFGAAEATPSTDADERTFGGGADAAAAVAPRLAAELAAFPGFVADNVAAVVPVSKEDMRATIAEYILDDSDSTDADEGEGAGTSARV